MKKMQRIVDLEWVPWTYAAIVALVAGIWAGSRFPAADQYGGDTFNGGAFILAMMAALVAVTPVILAFYIASRMVDNQVELGARLSSVAEDEASPRHVEAD
jgi:uncharacterized membrane protein